MMHSCISRKSRTDLKRLKSLKDSEIVIDKDAPAWTPEMFARAIVRKGLKHDHDAFLKKADKRRGFKAAYAALAVEYAIANEMLAARARAGLTQEEVVASCMGTTKSAVSRLESAGKHAPSLTSLKKYAAAVGCDIEIRLVPQR